MPNNILRTLFSESRARILAVMFADGAPPTSIRELARKTKLSHSGVRRELHRLADNGFLTSHCIARKICFAANPGHPLYSTLRELIQRTEGLADALRKVLSGDDVVLAFVYGGNPAESCGDINLLVVSDAPPREIARRIAKIPDPGRNIAPLVLDPAAYARRQRNDKGFRRIMALPKTLLCGDFEIPAKK